MPEVGLAVEELSRELACEEFICVKDVHKVYKSRNVEYPALRGVNVYVSKASFVAVVGPSGSGKTTLLHLLGGLDRPSRGNIVVGGVDITRLKNNELAHYRNRKVGFVFQFFNLVPYLSAVENVELPMALAGISEKLRRDRALQLLEMMGLRDKAFKRPTELSGGEQQRVAVARALANNPELILADEPTGNLDSVSGQALMKIFRELVDMNKVTIVMVTHNMENLKYVDKAYWLRDGKVVKEEVFRS